MLKKKMWANFQRIIEHFPQKFSLSSQKYGFGIRDPEKTYSGSRGQKGTGSRIRIRNTGEMIGQVAIGSSEARKESRYCTANIA
jgi:hypothetical protein